MNQLEKLDKILIGLASAKMDTEPIEQQNSGHKMKDICNILEIPIEKGEDQILEGILLSDGYIEHAEQVFKILIKITCKGIDFINKGGYEKLEEEVFRNQMKDELEMKLIKSNLITNKWSKYGVIASIIFSIIALIISIITMLHVK